MLIIAVATPRLIKEGRGEALLALLFLPNELPQGNLSPLWRKRVDRFLERFFCLRGAGQAHSVALLGSAFARKTAYVLLFSGSLSEKCLAQDLVKISILQDRVSVKDNFTSRRISKSRRKATRYAVQTTRF